VSCRSALGEAKHAVSRGKQALGVGGHSAGVQFLRNRTPELCLFISKELCSGSVAVVFVYGVFGERCGSVLGAFGERCGSVPGALRGRFGSVRGAVRERSRSVQRALGERFGSVQGALRERSKSVRRALRGRFGSVLGVLRGALRGALRERFGNVVGAFGELSENVRRGSERRPGRVSISMEWTCEYQITTRMFLLMFCDLKAPREIKGPLQ
jgi:hypothetical protein